jgi:hypothetical protein
MSPSVDKRESHGRSFAKYAVAFLRNSHVRLLWHFVQGEAEGLGAALQIADYPAAIPFFVLRCAGVMICHAVSQAIVEQNGDLSCGRCNGLGLSGTR